MDNSRNSRNSRKSRHSLINLIRTTQNPIKSQKARADKAKAKIQDKAKAKAKANASVKHKTNKFRKLINANRIERIEHHEKIKDDRMDLTILSHHTLYTLSFKGFHVSYFKIPIAGECLNSRFKSQLQDFIYDEDVLSKNEIQLSDSKTYLVTSMFDSLVTKLTAQCCASVASFTKSLYLKGRARPTICGFTTQISALLFLSIEHTIRNYPRLYETLRDDNMQTIIEGCVEYIQERERLFMAFQAELCNYASRRDGSISENTPSSLCHSVSIKFKETIMVGIPYIYTLFDTLLNTQHHFCVFRADSGDNCIISDSWAGLGHRTNWTRIMNITEFLKFMELIHTVSSVKIQIQLINLIFHVPYSRRSEYESQTHLYKVLVYAITPAEVERIENSPIDMLGGGPNRR